MSKKVKRKPESTPETTAKPAPEPEKAPNSPPETKENKKYFCPNHPEKELRNDGTTRIHGSIVTYRVCKICKYRIKTVAFAK